MNTLQMVLAEAKRLFIHRFPLICLLFVLLVVSLWWIWIPEQTQGYQSILTSIQQNQALALRLADEGDNFQNYELIDPEFALPTGYPLRDDSGYLIPENVSFVKNFIDDYYTTRQAALTSPYGPYSLETTISQIQWRAFGPVLVVWAILAVLTFSGDFRDGRYRKLISKGVSRSNIFVSKTILVCVASVSSAGILTLVMAYFGYGAYAGFKGAVVHSFSSLLNTQFFFNLLWLTAWLLLAYFLIGGIVSLVVSMLTGSYEWAMASAISVSGLALGFTLQFSPCESQNLAFLGDLTPYTLGYNFNSLRQYFWLGIENFECYRSPLSAAVIAIFFTGAIYMGLRFVFIQGRRSLESAEKIEQI